MALRQYIQQYGRESGREDLLTKVVSTKAEEGQDQLSDGGISIEVGNLIFAGTDTTSTTLTFLFWELARHKEWQRSLREELQNRCDSSPTFQQVQDLPVLDAVINEALRLHPAAPASLPRETPAGGKELDGYFIPEKTIASMQCYTTQRDPAFHPNPDSFKPERWIAQSEVTDELKELFEAFLNVTGRLTTLWNWSCWPNSRSGLGSVAKPSPLVQPTKRLTPGLGQPFAQLSRLQASSSKLRLYFSSRSPREAHHAFRACRSAKMTVLRTTSALRRGLQASTYASRQFSTSVRRDASWGFIGLGAMGYPMAKNLRAKIPEGDTMTVFDVNTAALDRFVKEAEPSNVTVAKAPREVVENSDNIVSALPEPQHVKGVYGDVFASKLPSPPTESSRIFIDCSTIDPTTSRTVAKQVTDHGAADFVDAPMSGGVVGARAGSLTFMVGADDKLMKRVEAILMLMGKKVWHMGPQGTGLSGKLANNYALAINNIGAAEAMNLGIKWGIKPKALADLLNSATGRSWPTEINNPVPGVSESTPSSRDYEGGFGVSLMRKDLRLAVAAAEEAGAKLVLAEKATEVYEETEKGNKGKDFSVVYRWLTGKS